MHRQQFALCHFYRLGVVSPSLTSFTFHAVHMLIGLRSNDGLTLLITSSDGFCSCLVFAPGELGQVYHGIAPVKHVPASINTATSSAHSTPTPTPTSSSMPPLVRHPSASANFPASPSSFAPPRPASPTRSMSTSSVATQSSATPMPDQSVIFGNSTPSMSQVPGVAAAASGTVGGVPMWTPPMTPAGQAGQSGHGGHHSASSSASGIVGYLGRRESESEREEPKDGKKRSVGEIEKNEGREEKRRRIAPTPVTEASDGRPAEAAKPTVVVAPATPASSVPPSIPSTAGLAPSENDSL